MRYIQAFFMSLGMFSSIPCPYRPWNEKSRHLMLVFLPPVGLLMGTLWYGIFLLLNWLNIPVPLQTAALVLYPFIITGFIHLDGFMDTSDAILSRRPLEEKLRILKDPHTGAFAVISVAILFTVCFAAMSAVMEQVHWKETLGIVGENPLLSLILIPVVTRCCSSAAVLAGKPLAHSQYQGENGHQKPLAKMIAVILMGLSVFLFAWTLGLGMWIQEASYSVLIVLTGTAISYFMAMIGAVHHLKGVSGDLAGYALTIAEAFALVMLAFVI